MTRGRKPAPVNTEPAAQIDDGAVRNALQAADQISAGHALVMQHENVLRDLGRIDGLHFLRRVADVAVAQIFENVRQSKAYLGVPYIKADGTCASVADFETFCEVKLHRSYRMCAELAQNLRVLGPELYEQSESIGLRTLDYRALRALPSDDQALVKRAIEETKSRDEVLDILQELAAKHQREREHLTQRVTDLEADAEATGKLIADKNAKLDQLAKEKKRSKLEPWSADIAAALDDIGTWGTVFDDCFRHMGGFIDSADELSATAPDGQRDQIEAVIHRLSELADRVAHKAARCRHEFDTKLSGLIAEDKAHLLTVPTE